MIIGRGLLATAFSKVDLDHSNLIIFSSGVSNSGEKASVEFQREKELLLETLSNNKGKRLIYFSTISIYDPELQQSPYVKHKKEIESLIAEKCSGYLIFRSPNVVGKGGNPATLMNFFVDRIRSSQEFVVWKNAERNFLGIDDFVILSSEMIRKIIGNKTIDLVYPYSFTIEEIVSTVESFIGRKGNYSLIEKGQRYVPAPSEDLRKVFIDLNIPVTKDYLHSLLKMYY
jgi:nucleoside-diphosphate-sugar epimerase